MSDRSQHQRRRMKLVDIVLVLVASVTITATIWPSVNGPEATRRREAVLQQQLRALRTQIDVYRFNHADRYPSESIEKQLTMQTSVDGSLVGDGNCGPYFRTGIPENPFNGQRSIVVAEQVTSEDVDESFGWIYDVTTHRIYPANSITAYRAFDGPQ